MAFHGLVMARVVMARITLAHGTMRIKLGTWMDTAKHLHPPGILRHCVAFFCISSVLRGDGANFVLVGKMKCGTFILSVRCCACTSVERSYSLSGLYLRGDGANFVFRFPFTEITRAIDEAWHICHKCGVDRFNAI